jgi:integrase
MKRSSGYRRELAVALEYFGADCALSSLSAAELQKWINWQRKKTITRGRNVGSTCKVSTAKGRLARLRAVVLHFKGLGVSGLNSDAFDIPDLGVDPDSIEDSMDWEGFEERLKRLERLGIPQSHEHAFSKVVFERSELTEMLRCYGDTLGKSGIDDFRIYCAVLFCSFTGTRRSELTRIRRADVILDGDLPQATLTKLKGRKNKAVKRQVVAVPQYAIEPLQKLLKMMPEDQECLFCSDDSHMTQNGFDQRRVLYHADQLTKAYDRVRSKTKWLHAAGWHKFRHTLASVLLQQGHSQIPVKETIGWCDDSMAERYSHLTVSGKAVIINRVFSSTDL